MGFRVRSRRAAGPPCAFQFPTIGTAVEIAADTAVFEYEFGNMVVANNCAAHITREYAPNGALLLERQAIRTYYTSAAAGVCDPRPMPVVTPPDTSTCIPPNEWEPCIPPNETLMAAVTTLGDESTDDSRHVYELRYKYDLSGRRTELRAPSALCGYCAPQTCTYSDSTGELTAVTTFLGHTVRFRYDDAGRLYRTEYPGGGYEEIGFDFDDRIESRQVVAQGGPLTSAVYTRDGRGLMTTVQVGGMFPRTVQLRYNGAGAVVEALGATNSYASGAEFFEVDGLGNRLRQWRAGLPATSEDPQRERLSLYSYGRLEERRAPPALQPFDSMERWYYDQSGNQVHSVAFMDGVAGGGGDQQFMTMAASGSGGLMVEESRSYYGADNKRRVFNRHVGGLAQSNPGGVYEEYRYDALGRRVLTRSRTTHLCNEPCGSYIERVVWDGDQVLGEFRARGDMDDFTLEQDDAISDQSTQYAFGRVLYTHAGGIDMPVAIHRFGINVEPTVFPYVNWRGEFEGGLLPDGQSARSCVTNCPPVNWPGDNLTVDGGQVLVPQVQSWYGSLLGRKTDGSGLQYLRNRYHDPSTGRFTQVDPIGFAGGLNLYGFAGGDPVNFSDPFGLCPPEDQNLSDCPSSILPFIELGRNARATNQAVGLFAGISLSGGAVGAAVRAGVAAWVARAGSLLSDGAAAAPAGTAATIHGAQRMSDPSRLGAEGVQRAVANATRTFTQRDGASVFAQQINGRFNVVVQDERGVITTFKNLSEKSLQRLAKNYGWEPK